ncbi:hypothetical protein QWY99_15695 [Flavobacterium branchiarum]|uniref:AMIN domain-containing protein n=1 Tax=Flavobacterium branchiarum TaxID=1114870 RepID=A0ABV5FLR9_9FLAO|nr:hypothetical protein [Flavobacterium branchiarum]MDN3674484.1 hypothetical protein [Flavobacterium branchiarum]
MQLNKLYFILIFFILSINKIYSQPTPKRFYFYGNINISDNNVILSFDTRDSVNFISNNPKIIVNIYEVIKIVNIHPSVNIRPSVNTLLKLENNYNKNFYILKIINNCFKIKNKKYEFYDGKRTNRSSKILFKIEKEKKIMLVYFDFTRSLNNPQSDTKIENFIIDFKEGTYEIIDSENHKLIPIQIDKL